MVIAEIDPGDALSGCRQTMELPDSPDASIEDTWLAALLWRSAGILCCASSKLGPADWLPAGVALT